MTDEQPPQAEGVQGGDIGDAVQAAQARREERQEGQQPSAVERTGPRDPTEDSGVLGPDGEELSLEEVEDKAERKEMIAQLLTRGVVNDRLDVRRHLGDEYDPGLHYEWIRETDQDIERAKALGFHIVTREHEETDEAHGTGDNRIRIADVILMATSKEHHELIQEVKRERKEQRRNAGKKDYLRKAQRENPDVPVLNPEGVEA